MKNRPFHQRLAFALTGIATAWRRERSLRVQSAVAVVALLALVLLRASALWWAVVVLAIAIVITAELFNSALEALIDHLHPDQHPEVGALKDMAAAAVLVSSIGAAVVGALFLWSTF
ncbi:diacylglycerol kinase [Neotabrizicola shimadae]|uniref:Diacylglycerol kinase n=1 Tax=Neotabrizicola shimadae TaxID=2807096 RepID=A0A8G1EAJ8_9RHOB|nr:diacylglycerol kinase [Neotabrizicola shimadae]QYZ68412.1 diacylglycerol kinase [Neotabrizicola shimadae]